MSSGFNCLEFELPAMDTRRTHDSILSEMACPGSVGARDGLASDLASLQLSSSPQPQQRKEPLHEVLAMGKGDGKDSYSKNSLGQAAVSKTQIPVLAEALEKVTLPSSGPVVVADLGCSSGTNSIDHIALITDKLKLRLPKSAEFQVYFNDLPSNDFNNLFKLLSSDRRANDIFASGVPGSYFGRLFPLSSVHVFHSSICLHWLSKVPDEVLNKGSLAYNRGQTWIMHSRSAVAKAYQKQSSVDLKNFLLARADELVPGGLLFFYCFGSPTLEPNDLNDTFAARLLGQDTQDIWSDLIAEGLLTEEQRDSFNFPVYLRNVEDLREAVASCGSLFHVLRVEQHRIERNLMELWATSDSKVLAKKAKSMYKSLFSVLLEAHVGKKAAEVVAERFEILMEKKIREGSLPYSTSIVSTCVVSLIRQ